MTACVCHGETCAKCGGFCGDNCPGYPHNQFPPIPQQIANAAAATARVGWAVLKNEQVKVSQDVLAQRRAICSTCNHWVNGRCELCGCYTKLKLRLATEKCPAGKWGATIDEEVVSTAKSIEVV